MFKHFHSIYIQEDINVLNINVFLHYVFTAYLLVSAARYILNILGI